MTKQMDEKVTSTSGYIYLNVPDSVKDQIHSMDGVLYDDMHLTLAFYTALNEVQVKIIDNVLEDYVEYREPLKGTIGGIGYFDIGQLLVEWIPADIPSLIDFRAGVLRETRHAAINNKDHGFAPHISRRYLEKSNYMPRLPFNNIPIEFNILGFGWHDADGFSRKKHYQIGNGL